MWLGNFAKYKKIQPWSIVEVVYLSQSLPLENYHVFLVYFYISTSLDEKLTFQYNFSCFQLLLLTYIANFQEKQRDLPRTQS